jgi:DNA-binding PadR family transcriptional regulator
MSGDIMKRPPFKGMFKLFVLYFLREVPLHGYALMEKFEEQFRMPKPSSSFVYPALTRLERSGFIEVLDKGEREKKRYKITKKGLDYLTQHKKELNEMIKRFRIFAELSELGGDDMMEALHLMMDRFDELSDEQKKKLSIVLKTHAEEIRSIVMFGGK